MQPIGENHPLRRHFSAVVEHAFCTEVGMCDPRLTDYLSDLLVNFTHIDTLNTLRRIRGKRLEQVATILAGVFGEEGGNGSHRDMTLYRHIGDFTLFWAGMYPEHLRRDVSLTADGLHEYVARGKRSYGIVADLARPDDVPPRDLFQHLSEDFEYCLHGLGIVRKEWEHPERRPHGESDLIL